MSQMVKVKDSGEEDPWKDLGALSHGSESPGQIPVLWTGNKLSLCGGTEVYFVSQH